jgi:Domain of unknown function (DUF4186)
MKVTELRQSRALPEPLDIKCTSADCDNDLHCFKTTRKLRAANATGLCRYCGANLIDWGRLHRRDIRDATFTFASLRREMIRHYYWHVSIDDKASLHARRKGRIALRDAAERRLWQSIGSATPFRDGYQTPKAGNVIFYGQHAVAACCRTCLEYWHDVPKGRPLADDEVAYLADLVMLYVNERMPALGDLGERLPSEATLPSTQTGAA